MGSSLLLQTSTSAFFTKKTLQVQSPERATNLKAVNRERKKPSLLKFLFDLHWKQFVEALGRRECGQQPVQTETGALTTEQQCGAHLAIQTAAYVKFPEWQTYL